MADAMNQNREELLFQLALTMRVGERGSALFSPLRDDLQRLALCRLRFGQRRDAFVQRGEHAAATEGKT